MSAGADYLRTALIDRTGWQAKTPGQFDLLASEPMLVIIVSLNLYI